MECLPYVWMHACVPFLSHFFQETLKVRLLLIICVYTRKSDTNMVEKYECIPW